MRGESCREDTATRNRRIVVECRHMRDTWIIAITAVGFPLFGLGVFFFWRYKYGVWAPHRRAKAVRGDVRIVTIEDAAHGSTRRESPDSNVPRG